MTNTLVVKSQTTLKKQHKTHNRLLKIHLKYSIPSKLHYSNTVINKIKQNQAYNLRVCMYFERHKYLLHSVYRTAKCA